MSQQPSIGLLRARLEKLERIRARGVDPYPSRFDRSHTIHEAAAEFQTREDRDGAGVRTDAASLAGRIVALRGMGGATFADIMDASGRLQLLFRQNVLGESYESLPDLDIGDWLGVHGPVFRTRTGEVTLEVEQWSLLCKSLKPLPEKWHGLSDVEARYRQRYLDLIANEDARRVAVQRSRLVSSMRRFMDGRGFMEVETPVLVSVAAGGMADSFETHYQALDRDLHLRIATELYLKRLIVGGLEKVYEIGKVFRNEGVDLTHSPEYTMMESYEAFVDYTDVMRMVEEMVHAIAIEVLGTAVVEFRGNTIDLTPPWQRLSLHDEVKKHAGIDFLECSDIESLRIEMRAAGVDVSQQMSWAGLLDKLISSRVEPNLIQPSFLVDYPLEMSPLAKKKADDPRLVERFEGFAGGMEICNAFTELNDPIDQRLRFEEQEARRSQFQEEETDRLDEDFLVAIEHGMPPTGGLGIGVDRLAMVLLGEGNIREVVLFPQLRSR